MDSATPILVRSLRHPADLRSAGSLRYRAYRHGGHIEARPSESLLDDLDQLPSAETLGAYAGHELHGTIRVLRKTRGQPLDLLLAYRGFGAELAQAVGDAGAVECCRLAVDPGLGTAASLRAKLSLLRVAAHIVTTEGFDYGVASARDEHLGFYTRFMGLQPASAPKVYPGLLCPMTLLIGKAPSTAAPSPTLQALQLRPAQQQSWASERAVAL